MILKASRMLLALTVIPHWLRQVFLAGVGSEARKMMKNYLARLFMSENTASGECGPLALEVPRPFFAEGYISACGDAL